MYVLRAHNFKLFCLSQTVSLLSYLGCTAAGSRWQHVQGYDRVPMHCAAWHCSSDIRCAAAMCTCRSIYKLLSKEADVTLLRQAPGSSSSSETSGSIQLITQLTGSTPGSSYTSGSSSSSSSSSEAVRAAAVALGYSPDSYTVHLKPAPLEFPPVQFGTIDVDKATGGSGANAAAGVSSDAATTVSFTSSSSNSTSDPSSSSSSSSSRKAGLPDVGYLKLLSFSATAPQEVAQALVDMQYEAASEQGGHGLAGIIIDLRDNPGAGQFTSPIPLNYHF
jgi:hypothetical protein